MATLDVITSSEAKDALSIPAADTSHDSVVLPAYITAVSLRLDELVGPIVNRTLTNEAHDGGGYAVRLDKYPQASVTSVTEYRSTDATALTAETVSTSPANGYLWIPTTGVILRRSGKLDYPFPPGRQNVLVTYVAGRAANTAAVDSRYKLAAQIMLAAIWRREQAGLSQSFGELPSLGATFAVPNAVLELLNDQLLGPEVA